jgi:HK97 family phage prohead protease
MEETMQDNHERRDLAFESDDEIVVEQRSDGRPVIRGYAVIYNRLSVDLGGFKERVLPGAFDAALGKRGSRDLVSYFNHNPDVMLGRESSGTLKVWSDDKGVGFEVTPPATRADILELISRRDVKGASFTFSVDKGGEAFSTDEKGRAIREIRAATIYELGPVVQPAYPSTTAQVAMRSYQQWLASQATPEATPPVVGPDIAGASMRLRAARLRSFMRGNPSR